MTKVNDDQIQLFCAFGIVSIIKIWGEFLLSSSVFLRSQIKFQAISLIHKSETCIPNQGGGRQGWSQLVSLELWNSLVS